ncbi:hypothetical protein ACLWBD_12590 [Bdellovibrio sp. HCB117]|uniref:hypothetical protein n=1 Tax=Bdellovibrio sp. HCB117 TaxID=3394359 RepID=UPI0039B6A7D2
MKKFVMVSMLLFSLKAFPATPPAEQPRWPQEYKIANERKVTVFQPQAESLKDNVLKARAALRVQDGKNESYGSMVVTGSAMISKDQARVDIQDLKIQEVTLPSLTEQEKSLKEEMEKQFTGKSMEISYASLLKNLEVNGEQVKKVADLKNTPPQFIFSTVPSLLIMVDGEPVWTDIKGVKGVQRILNSSALIMHEDKKPYYLWALGKWFEASELHGEYRISKGPSSKYEMTKDDLIKEKKVDPIAGKTTDGKSIYGNATPKIFIATKPTELLQSDGDPQYQSISGTSLLYMSNSSNSIFLDSKSNEYYVLVSGRWFKNKDLSGDWAYVSAKELPADFKKIPANSPVAEILVSVPGTSQSTEALIATQIPQTATVKRDLKPQKIECDQGRIQWEKIAGTSLEYAKNCNSPLIKVEDKMYYVVQNAVWFSSDSPTGPWVVAVAVPKEIYNIPASSPLYYVTYVHIYSVAKDVVTVGYTPGYNGTYVSPDGTIVYGTGYNYPSYQSSTVWYPASATYGFGAGYGWGYTDGFFMGFAMSTMMYPWGWGTCCWGGVYVNVDVTNVYTKWGKHSVITGPTGRGMTVNTIGGAKFARGNNDNIVYTRKDGQVYRRTGKDSWQRYSGPGTWSDVARDNQSVKNELENMHASGNFNERRDLPERPAGDHQPLLRGGGGFGGGGFRGGGFRR